jgi:hypothetical protein
MTDPSDLESGAMIKNIRLTREWVKSNIMRTRSKAWC